MKLNISSVFLISQVVLNTGVEFGTDDFLLEGLIVEALVVVVYGRGVRLQVPRVRRVRVGPAVIVGN